MAYAGSVLYSKYKHFVFLFYFIIIQAHIFY